MWYSAGYSSRRTASGHYTERLVLLGRRTIHSAPCPSTVLVVVASLSVRLVASLTGHQHLRPWRRGLSLAKDTGMRLREPYLANDSQPETGRRKHKG